MRNRTLAVLTVLLGPISLVACLGGSLRARRSLQSCY